MLMKHNTKFQRLLLLLLLIIFLSRPPCKHAQGRVQQGRVTLSIQYQPDISCFISHPVLSSCHCCMHVYTHYVNTHYTHGLVVNQAGVAAPAADLLGMGLKGMRRYPLISPLFLARLEDAYFKINPKFAILTVLFVVLSTPQFGKKGETGM